MGDLALCLVPQKALFQILSITLYILWTWVLVSKIKIAFITQGRVNMPLLDVKGRLAVQLHLAIVSKNNLYIMYRFFLAHIKLNLLY